jgi:hypothetical protein
MHLEEYYKRQSTAKRIISMLLVIRLQERPSTTSRSTKSHECSEVDKESILDMPC